MSDEITKTEVIPKSQAVMYSPATFIEKAIESNAGIEQLERLMALQERWEKNQAYKAFLEAMTNFQSECPPIPKTKKVAYKEVKYRFAPLDVIATTIQPALKNNGLSYRWEYEEKEGKIVCYCVVSHIMGHSERSRMETDKDISGSKNDIQAIGSARTYLQRYTLISALGLTTTDEDVDGVTVENRTIFQDRIKSWDFTDHIIMKANAITDGDDFKVFLNDLPSDEDVATFKELLTRLVETDEQKAGAIRAKLWNDFQKLHKGVSKQWLESLSKAKIIKQKVHNE
jgi:hypothetical protein